MVVQRQHREVRDLEPATEPVIEARLGEEHRAKELLVQLRDDVFAHAEHEERGESPMLRAHHPPERLRAMTATAREAIPAALGR